MHLRQVDVRHARRLMHSSTCPVWGLSPRHARQARQLSPRKMTKHPMKLAVLTEAACLKPKVSTICLRRSSILNRIRIRREHCSTSLMHRRTACIVSWLRRHALSGRALFLVSGVRRGRAPIRTPALRLHILVAHPRLQALDSPQWKAEMMFHGSSYHISSLVCPHRLTGCVALAPTQLQAKRRHNSQRLRRQKARGLLQPCSHCQRQR